MHCVVDSPVGVLRLEADELGLTLLKRTDDAYHPPSTPLLVQAAEQLAAYFDGRLRVFSLPLHLQGTPFQLKCWEALRTIPYGKTISYGQQALRVGNPKAARAVGGANHRNPISIIVPCHRVVGADGGLTGYGGGLDMKAWLLAHEREQLALPEQRAHSGQAPVFSYNKTRQAEDTDTSFFTAP